MNKATLIDKIAEDAGITKAAAATAVESFTQGITSALKKNQRVTLVGFGTWGEQAQSPHRPQSPNRRGHPDQGEKGRSLQGRQATRKSLEQINIAKRSQGSGGGAAAFGACYSITIRTAPPSTV